MAWTAINSEDRLVQQTFADHLRDVLGWDSVYAHNTETFGPNGTLGLGTHVPHYNRRADLVCFVNGLPLVFIELKTVYRNVRTGFDDNLTDYLNDSIPHAFHHNAFLVVSNGDRARYGSITSKWDHFAEWKRESESDKGRADAEALLDGMLAKERLLDIVENFILFDDSRAGGIRKIVARNHQVLGVNNAVASVERQEELKREFPLGARLLEYRAPVPEGRMIADAPRESLLRRQLNELVLPKRAHPDLGRLGVFWHTQGSGKSYSMAFFSEKVRRSVPGNFTFLIVTDREDLDDQIWRTFIGCGITGEKTPRAGSSAEGAPPRQSSLRIQLDPQVESAGDGAVQRPGRHHRDL